MADNWQQKLEAYCKKYNIPITYLAETLYEPKVVPMNCKVSNFRDKLLNR